MQLHRRLALLPRLSALLHAFPAILAMPPLVYAGASSDAQVWTPDESELTEIKEQVLRWQHAPTLRTWNVSGRALDRDSLNPQVELLRLPSTRVQAIHLPHSESEVTTKSPHKTLAKALQRELGCTYCQGLNAVRATQSRTIAEEDLDAATAFKVCGDAAARKDFDFFGLIKVG